VSTRWANAGGDGIAPFLLSTRGINVVDRRLVFSVKCQKVRGVSIDHLAMSVDRCRATVDRAPFSVLPEGR
jgi:hypothetical protein